MALPSLSENRIETAGYDPGRHGSAARILSVRQTRRFFHLKVIILEYEFDYPEENRGGLVRYISFLMPVMMAAAILLIGAGIALHLPQLYSFYFNDSQTVSEIDYGITVSEMGGAIGKYLISTGDEPFQVYEINGEYRDAVFASDDQDVMKKARAFLYKENITALMFFVLAVLIFLLVKKMKLTALLRKEAIAGAGITAGCLILECLILSRTSVQQHIYDAVIGMDLPKTSSLSILFGDGGLYSSFFVFNGIFCIVLTILFVYISYQCTRPERVFY